MRPGRARCRGSTRWRPGTPGSRRCLGPRSTRPAAAPQATAASPSASAATTRSRTLRIVPRGAPGRVLGRCYRHGVPAAAVADLPLLASGKVREIYDLGDRLLMVASDRISTYDVVHPNADPRQGQGPDRPVRLLVRQDRPHRRQPLRLGHRRRARRGPRPRDRRAQAARCCRSSASCAATSPARAGRTTRRPARSRASSCRRACGVRAAARADLHAVDEGRGRPRRGDRLRPRGRARRRPRPDGARARRLDRAVPLRRRARARARRDPRRHEVRVRPRRATASSSSATRC